MTALTLRASESVVSHREKNERVSKKEKEKTCNFIVEQSAQLPERVVLLDWMSPVESDDVDDAARRRATSRAMLRSHRTTAIAEQLKQSLIPDIVVSGENIRKTTGVSAVSKARGATALPQLRWPTAEFRSVQRIFTYCDDVVEAFSWTMAETIIEDIMKWLEIGSPNKLPGKSILKISNNDSLNRSQSGSLKQHPDIAEQQHQNSPMFWSHCSTSIPCESSLKSIRPSSLKAIDEIESLNTSIYKYKWMTWTLYKWNYKHYSIVWCCAP